MSKEYTATASASIRVRRAGSELLDAAKLAEEPIKTHLYQCALLCDETLIWIWQQQTAAAERMGVA